MQSSSSLMDCLFQPNPRPQAEILGHRLNLTFSNTKELMEELIKVDFQEIVNVEAFTFSMAPPGRPFGFQSFEFVPSVEPKNTKNAFLTEEPIERLINGKYQKVPLMIGNTNFEGMFMALYFYTVPNALQTFNANPDFIVPYSFGLSESSPNLPEVIKDLQNLYFDGNTEGTLEQWLKVYSDGIGSSDDRVARFYAASPDYPEIFYYEFAFDGSLNFFKKILSLGSFQGVSHADELFYIFKEGIDGFVADERSALIRDRMTKMWSNFAKFGNPTPGKSDLLPEVWKPYTASEKFYFVIDEVLENRKDPPRMNVISDLYVRLTGHF